MTTTTADTAPRHNSGVPAVRVYVLDGRPVLGLGGLSRILNHAQTRSLAHALSEAADGAELTASVPRARHRAEVHPTAAGLVRIRIGVSAMDLFDHHAFALADQLADAAEACRDVLAAPGQEPAA